MEWLSKLLCKLSDEHLITVAVVVVLVIWLFYKLMLAGLQSLSSHYQDQAKEHVRTLDGLLTEMKRTNELQTRQITLMDLVLRHQERCGRYLGTNKE